MVRTFGVILASAIGTLGIGLAAPVAPAQAAPYKNCTQAKQNGDCDIPSSSDKYGPWLDRDQDGLGCEC